MRPFTSVISIDEARKRLAEGVRPIERTERVARAAAEGRVASADITAEVDVPPFSRSAMDGYAVIAADTRGAPKTLRILDRIYTGQVPSRRVEPGSCAEIATGAPLPEGA